MSEPTSPDKAGSDRPRDRERPEPGILERLGQGLRDWFDGIVAPEPAPVPVRVPTRSRRTE